MAKFWLTQKAVEDLSGIWWYTCENWSENQADIYYRLLLNSFNEIAEKPGTGKNYSNILENLKGLKVGRHIVFYQEKAVNFVQIIRILHEQMDIRNRMTEK